MLLTARQFTWARKGGYECSSKGDKRFSAIWATMPDHRSIEAHYQCCVKGYDPGGTDWRKGKGLPPLTDVNLWEEYLSLWRAWANLHIPLMRELFVRASEKDFILSDCFATTEVNQAHALAVILNELVAKGKKNDK